MGIPEDWGELLFNLNCLTKGSAQRQFKHAIRYAWGGMCCFCRDKRATTVDHLRPRSKGGSSFRSNLVPCCSDCNKDKASQNWVEWFRKQDFYNEVAEQLINEWIENKHVSPEPNQTIVRTTVRAVESTVRSLSNESSCTGKDCSAVA